MIMNVDNKQKDFTVNADLSILVKFSSLTWNPKQAIVCLSITPSISISLSIYIFIYISVFLSIDWSNDLEKEMLRDDIEK